MLNKIIVLPVFWVFLTNPNPSASQTLNGAGATFPYPIYAQWFDSYQKLHRGVEINYSAVGSGEGIRRVSEGEVDFGASDGPMNDQQLADASARLHSAILHFPTVLGAAVPAYNIPGVRDELRFTPEALSGIFLGTIHNWKDPAIAQNNPGVHLPASPIVVIHRSEGSGTTYCWTDYLSKISPEWQRRVGKGTSVVWPTGQAAKSNEGVSGLLKQTPYSIGYVELTYALQNGIPYGRVRNSSGQFVKADLASVTAAAASAAKNMPAHFRVSITDPPGAAAYPIATFTWLLVPQRMRSEAQRRELVGFLRWALTDGQKMVAPLGYAPIPKEVATREIRALAQVQ
jgi:phosphate transport system substrate-binding protein